MKRKGFNLFLTSKVKLRKVKGEWSQRQREGIEDEDQVLEDEVRLFFAMTVVLLIVLVVSNVMN